MILYLSIIGIAVAIVSTLNIIFGLGYLGMEWWQVILLTISYVVAEFIIDGILAWTLHALPDRSVDPNKKIFDVGKKERKFYENLHIKSWKDKVWELGGLGGFRKNKVDDATDPKYLNQFLIENNKGVVIHVVSVLAGFIILPIIPKAWLTIALPVAIVNAILNLMSTCVLRYNIPRLKVAKQRAERVIERENKIDDNK